MALALSKTPCWLPEPANDPLGAMATFGIAIWSLFGNEPAGVHARMSATATLTMLVPPGDTKKEKP